ncbi:MAG: ABC transporter permease [Eubacteriales bacterium]|nr:ABC transporter permease [Eubacteriales bacterium]
MDWIVSVVAATIGYAAPVLYASLGEIISERAGVLNLGLEGVMLIGAVTGYITAVESGSLALAILATMLAGMLTGLVYAVLTVTLQTNQVVSGLALVTVGTGLSGFFGKPYTAVTGLEGFKNLAIPGLSQIPVLGPMLFKQNVMVYALYILVPLIYVFLYKTRPGLKLRALGENPGALDAAGMNVFGMRYLYVILGNAIVALGGAYFTLAYIPGWQDSITAGKGWIAAALVIFSSWNPAMATVGALIFGGVEVLGLRLQVLFPNIGIPTYFISMLPYVATVLVLILSTGSFRKHRKPGPAALGAFYDREAR